MKALSRATASIAVLVWLGPAGCGDSVLPPPEADAGEGPEDGATTRDAGSLEPPSSFGDDEPEDGAEPWRDGDRLRALLIDGGEGAHLFDGWFDEALGGECVFRLHPDGLARCEPPGPLSDLFIVGYRDADCTEAIALFDGTPGTALTMVAGRDDDGCNDDVERSEPEFVRVGGPTEATELFTREGDRCVPAGYTPPPGPMTLLLPLPPSELVTAEVREGSGDLRARWYAADDGSRETVGLVAGGVRCELLETPGMPPVCLDSRSAHAIGTDSYSDATCETPLLGRHWVPACSSDLVVAPARVCDAAVGGPGRPTTLYRARWTTTADVHRVDPGDRMCYPVDVGGRIEILPQTDAVPLDALPPLNVAVRGRGRLQAHFGEADDGRPARNARPTPGLEQSQTIFYDTELEQHCAVTPTREGAMGVTELRCLPFTDRPFETAYLDAACTQHGIVVVDGGCSERFETTPFALVGRYEYPDDFGTDWQATHVLRPLPDEPVSTWYVQRGSALEPFCERVDGSADGVRLRPTEAIPVEDFPLVRVR